MSTRGEPPTGEDEEKKTDARTGLPQLMQGSVVTTNMGFGTQHLHTDPSRVSQEVPSRPRSAGSTDHEYIRQMMESMQKQTMQQMQAFMAQQQQQIQAIQQQVGAAAAAARRQTIAHTSYPATPTAGEYSAGASLPLPPRVVPPHRASFGRPSTPAASIPFTPAAQRVASAPRVQAGVDSSDEEDNEASDVEAADAEMPRRDRRMEHVRKTMLQSVKPFYGRTKLDTYTVIDWVEKVDTEFSIHMGAREEGRMDVVRSLLAGQALKWANRRVKEVMDSGQVAEWHAIRIDFIDAHLGSSTMETFKAELRALRLGGEDCRNPSELNAQFDRLAELGWPLERTSTTLGEEYGRIVAASNAFIYRNIQRSAVPVTLEEWKMALARHWNAERLIDNMTKQLRPLQEARGGGRGRGQHSNQPSMPTTARVASLETANDTPDQDEDPPRKEGEQETANAMSGTQRGRGGGMGRGGRGRGKAGGRPLLSYEERQKRWNEGRCFNCNEVGHRVGECSNQTPSSQQAQGKGPADK